MTDADRRQQEIADEFAFVDDWMLQLQQLIEIGEAMVPLPDADRTDDRLVRGCQSRVWIDAGTEAGTFRLRADSDSQLVRGLAAVLVRVFDGLPVDEVATADLWIFREVGLAAHLSPNRANGLDAMQRAIRGAARAS